VVLDDEQHPDYRHMDAAVAIAPASAPARPLEPLSRATPEPVRAALEASGLVADRDFFVAFSPERLFTGAVFRNLSSYPKLVGGIGPASTDRAAAFYASVLDAEVVAMSGAEAAELSKLADTTYRDDIAFANELARYADRTGVEVIRRTAASHIHEPGLMGGHCIGLPALPPVAPRDGAAHSGR
jgi:UDP-N-acetyl-D-mannosaminuronic acid dehydrogenase